MQIPLVRQQTLHTFTTITQLILVMIETSKPNKAEQIPLLHKSGNPSIKSSENERIT